MRIIILGAGTVGQQVARQLVSEGKDVVLIEKNADVVQRVSNVLDCLVVNDEGTDSAVLRRVGVADADFFISLTGSDEANMVACSIVAREFPRPQKVARVRNVAYSSLLAAGPSGFLGVDRLINPEMEAARTILSSIAHGVVSDVMDLGASDLHLQSLRVEEESPFKGRTVKEIRRRLECEFLIPVILRDGEALVPSGDTVVEEEGRAPNSSASRCSAAAGSAATSPGSSPAARRPAVALAACSPAWRGAGAALRCSSSPSSAASSWRSGTPGSW
jgi:trk system potassium uptake protein TrkA